MTVDGFGAVWSVGVDVVDEGDNVSGHACEGLGRRFDKVVAEKKIVRWYTILRTSSKELRHVGCTNEPILAWVWTGHCRRSKLVEQSGMTVSIS